MSNLKAEYERDGYLILSDSIFPQETIAAASAGMDKVRAGEYDTGAPPMTSPWNPGDSVDSLCKIEQPQVANHAIRALISHPALGEFVAKALGAQMVQVWWVQLLYKPPTLRPDGKNVIGWHQDKQYWGVWEEDSEVFTAWVAVSDVTARSGPMKFVTGSNHWGLQDTGEFYSQDNAALQSSYPIPPGQKWEEKAVLLPPGGLSLHHWLTIHGSEVNTSQTARKSFAIHLRTEKSRPDKDRHEGLTRFLDDPDINPIIYGRS